MLWITYITPGIMWGGIIRRYDYKEAESMGDHLRDWYNVSEGLLDHIYQNSF
jgi:hypothetical protein